ncbi:unnamed protein product [Prunus armeniaca]|uniref:Uncharacterized protein n=1 Tax=Prunus armeniaca TaxID=36596 RepID=A0A6J5TM76_PRUAR|nr:unnamed protein product [Prunus armeniaca]
MLLSSLCHHHHIPTFKSSKLSSNLRLVYVMEDHTSNSKKRIRDNSDGSEHDSAEVKRLREDLLGFLDDSEPDAATQDLDSVMKSFEEEIGSTTSCPTSPRPSPATPSAPVPVVDLTSDSGESNPDLGYLLGASDDELGLPPSENFSEVLAEGRETELVRVSSDSSGIDEFWRFDDHPPSYDSFELGGHVHDSSTDYVAFDGLFENSDVYFDSSDYTDFSWRFETLPAQ